MTQEFVTLPRDVVDQALEAMESGVTGTDYDRKAQALRAALEQPPTTEECSAVEQPDPAYLLRDLAADIGVGAMELIVAIRDAGLGYYSVNMMLPAKVCVAMCQRFAAAPEQPAPEQPQVEHEPVAWMDAETRVLYECDTSEVDRHHGFKPTIPLYTHPQPQRKPLTRDRVKAIQHELSDTVGCSYETMARAIEAAHNIK